MTFPTRQIFPAVLDPRWDQAAQRDRQAPDRRLEREVRRDRLVLGLQQGREVPPDRQGSDLLPERGDRQDRAPGVQD